MSTDPFDKPCNPRQHSFPTTQWSIVLAAGTIDRKVSRVALAQLCETYWYPLYAYVRRRVAHVQDAQDLTQAFFSGLLEKEAINCADPNRGRFRAFLLTSLKNFLNNEWGKVCAAKRGHGKFPLSLDFESGETRYRIEPFHELTAERLFERRWVFALLDQVLENLRRELIEAGKHQYFEHFKESLTEDATSDDYVRTAQSLGITPAAAKQTAYRLRKRYRDLFRAEVARTVAAEEDMDDEVARLLKALA